jgi:hypothetical protein
MANQRQRQRAGIEQLLSTGFVELLTPATQGAYLVNSDENFNNTVSKAEYEEYRRELEDYLRRNCTVVDKYEYDIPDVERGAVELYNCPVGKVGVYKVAGYGSSEYDYEVYVGKNAWLDAESFAMESLKKEIESGDLWSERDQAMRIIKDIKHMPD